MNSSVVMAVIAVFSAVASIAMLVLEAKRFLRGQGRYGMQNSESK
ncbi:hypothetical protein [Haladaptatus sp. CMAA 1911]